MTKLQLIKRLAGAGIPLRVARRAVDTVDDEVLQTQSPVRLYLGRGVTLEVEDERGSSWQG